MINKLSIFFSVLAVAFGFTACSDDDTPRYHEPDENTTIILNTPPFAQQLYYLQPDGTMEFTVREQPDYGFNASVYYGLEMSLDKQEVYELTPSVLTSSKIEIKQEAFATGLCSLNGVETEEDWNTNLAAQGVQKVYVRATAQLPGVESSLVKSDWVELAQVKGYFAIPQPGFIYLIGSPAGWIEPAASKADALADWRLFETTIGSEIYSGVFDMPASPMFRFYTELNGWDDAKVSFGLKEANDDNTDIELTDGQWQGTLVTGKGNINIPDYTGGKMTIVVNMKDKSIQIMAGAQTVIEPKYIYLIGQPGTWNEPTVANESKFVALVDKTDSGIYSATVKIEDNIDWFNFRFAKALYQVPEGGNAGDAWGAVEWIGCSAGADNYEINLPFTGTANDSQDTWRIMNAQVGDMIKFTVNMSVNPVEVNFETVTE